MRDFSSLIRSATWLRQIAATAARHRKAVARDSENRGSRPEASAPVASSEGLQRRSILYRLGTLPVLATALFLSNSAAIQARSDRDLRFSPDGNVFVFASTRDRTTALYVGSLDGSASEPRRITEPMASVGGPAWSPDGTVLAFQAMVDGNFDIYTMHPDGGPTIRRTDNEALDLSPSFSPDGKRLFYATDREGGQLRSIELESGEDTLFATEMEHHNPIRFSPEGSRLAGVVIEGTNWEIAVLSTDVTERRVLAPHAARDSSPVWSPDGTRIAFSSKRDATDWDIYVVDVDGANLTRLTDHAGRDFRPAWLPDGTAIIFASNRSGDFVLYRVAPDGTDLRRFEPWRRVRVTGPKSDG